MLIEKGAEQAVFDGDIDVLQYPKLKHAINLLKCVTHKNENIEGKLPNLWIYGPPGVGKSMKAREDNPDYYDKPLNKWWDDFKGQHCVILDDFSKEH